MYPGIDFFLHFYSNFPFHDKIRFAHMLHLRLRTSGKNEEKLAYHKNENPVFMIKIQF